MCPCARESITHTVEEREIHIEKRDVSEMRERDECYMEQCCALDDAETYIAILGDR